MKVLQFLLSVCATFIGIMYILGSLNVYVSFDLAPYYYFLFVLGFVVLFMIPYELFKQEDDIVLIGEVKVDKQLVHQLISEELTERKNMALAKTNIEVAKGMLTVEPHISILELGKMTLEEDAEQLVEKLNDRMKKVFGNKNEYKINIIYVSK